MARGNFVNWDSLKETYNRMHNTQYKTSKEWVIELYNKHKKYVSPVSEELGVSFNTVSKYLDGLGVLERKPKGGNNYINRPMGKKEQLFLGITEKTMLELTRKQVMERCGISHTTFNKLAKKYGRTYLKGRSA
jgi:transcriptional regulator with XRE-family HTH domain